MKIVRLIILFNLFGMTPIQAQDLGYINDPDGYTNLRLEPSGKSDIIGIIISGQEFKYFTDKTDWRKVNFQNRTGYIHKSRIKDFKEVESDIEMFFLEFYLLNRNSSEYSETNNEKLFTLAQNYPLATLTAFCKAKKEVQEFLISEFESPVHNLIDLQLTYFRLVNLNSSCSYTSKIVDALMIAANKGGFKLKLFNPDYTDIDQESDPKKRRGYGQTNKYFAATIAGRPITYYLNHSDIDGFSKLFYQGQFVPSDNTETFSFLDSIMTDNNETRPFYFFVFNSVLNISDGALSEMVAMICLKYIEKQPCEFLRYIKYHDYEDNKSNWIQYTAFALYSETNYNLFVIFTGRIIDGDCLELKNDFNLLKDEIGLKLVK